MSVESSICRAARISGIVLHCRGVHCMNEATHMLYRDDFQVESGIAWGDSTPVCAACIPEGVASYD